MLGEIEAFRCWRVLGDYLASVNGVIWLPDAPMTGEDVDLHNYNGVHAFKTMEQLELNYGSYEGFAVGRVKLWGTIVEHETGYRAQYARPVSIVSAPPLCKERIEANYGLKAAS